MNRVEPEVLCARDYQEALFAQEACNLSGIVYAFARTMGRICNESRERGEGTDWRNHHPICRLYAEQILFLTIPEGESATSSYSRAYQICAAASKEAQAELREES